MDNRRQKQQGYLYGMMVLAAGTVVVKLIGALFKIPLTNILGGVGMSYFNVAYDLYYPLYALFVSGVPVAVSKLVSESMARGQARDARRLLRLSATIFVGIGLAGSVVMVLGAGWFCRMVQNPEAKHAVWMLAPALFFGCVTAAFRGFFQGLQDMRPTAVSQVVEAVAKLVLGLVFSYGVTLYGLRDFKRTGEVFGVLCAGVEQARLAVLPYAAAGAILGVTASSFCGGMYLYLRHKRGRGGIPLALWRAAPKAAPARVLAKRLLAIAFPVCCASVITNLTSFIDLVSVMNRLNFAIGRSPEFFSRMYRGMTPAGVGLEKLATYLYGCYSGLAVPIYNLVPSLTATIGVSLLPAVSAAWAVRDRAALERSAGSALRLAAIISMPAGVGIAVLAEPLMRLLYFSKPMEVAAIASTLRLMGIGSIFVALTLPVNAVLQAVGRAGLPVKLMLWGGGIKLALNYLLVSVPQLNIHAAPVGTIFCYGFVLAVSLTELVRVTGMRLSALGVLGKPLFAALGCGAAAWAGFGLLGHMGCPEAAATLLAVGVGGGIYLILLLLTRTVTKTDLLMAPGGEKFANLLEKRGLLG